MPQVRILSLRPSKEDEKDVLTKNPDFIGVLHSLAGIFKDAES